VIVASAQLQLHIGDLDGNRLAARRAIEDAAEADARLIVLPELTASGYVFADRDEALSLGEDLAGPTVAEWATLAAARELVIVGGLAELDAGGSLFNTAVVIDSTGLRASYRKAHLWDREKDVFVPGDSRPALVDTTLGRIAVMVCYDLEFPEWMRFAALGGADIVCVPTNWPLAPRPDGERPGEVVRAQAAASTNRVYLIAADRCGDERGVSWTGGSAIIDPDGFVIAGPVSADEPALLLADIDPARARMKAVGDRNHVFDDRRLDLY
jgi:predicted amidohydrolase